MPRLDKLPDLIIFREFLILSGLKELESSGIVMEQEEGPLFV